MPILLAVDPALSAAEFIDVLRRSTLDERRPVDDVARMEAMVRHANLTVTARDTEADNRLVGVARSVTDFAFCCYLSDLAVDEAYQGQGIGLALMRRTRDEAQRLAFPGRPVSCFLFAAPKAEGYYPHVGVQAKEQPAFDFTHL